MNLVEVLDVPPERPQDGTISDAFVFCSPIRASR